MKQLINAIHAYCMNDHLYNHCQNMDDDDKAFNILQHWLADGVPDGPKTIADYIDWYGDDESLYELEHTYLKLCRKHGIPPQYKYEFDQFVERLTNIYSVIP